jgi:hypothetical protein
MPVLMGLLERCPRVLLDVLEVLGARLALVAGPTSQSSSLHLGLFRPEDRFQERTGKTVLLEPSSA